MKQLRSSFSPQSLSRHNFKYLFTLLIRQLTIQIKLNYLFWIPLIIITVLALITTSPHSKWVAIHDKFLHFATFLYLTLAWVWTNHSHKSLYSITSILFLYGLLVEWIQSFIPSRTASLSDIVANGAGCLLGYILAKCLQRLQKYQQNTKLELQYQEELTSISSQRDEANF